MSTASTISAEQKSKLLHHLDFSDTTIVVLHVGPKMKAYHVHKEVLCQHSRYFRTCLSDLFGGPITEATTLESTSCETFEDILRWIASARPEDIVDDINFNNEYVDYIAIYTFADMYDVPALRLVALRACQRMDASYQSDTTPHGVVVKMAFRDLPATAPLCRYLVRSCAMRWSSEWVTEQARSNLPYQFMAGVMSELASGKIHANVGSYLRVWCLYHEHDYFDTPGECLADIEKLRKERNNSELFGIRVGLARKSALVKMPKRKRTESLSSSPGI
ncbi:hypothetical protein BU16DRAFT_559191 [Lophium mytilinum]|uniref:BTB domain-containing protein n=1 Tax=Lophium mytilinum TaxID=390894 RepID=A0A6A6R0S5_9PEZI|nr:hypothetical protein BU16DRAFT_559191 [Lophium mytilinum]